MKSPHERRRKAERKAVKDLPGVNPSVVVTPLRQEGLVNSRGCIGSVDVQGNEFIATSTNVGRLTMYTPTSGEVEDLSNSDSNTDITTTGDDGLVPEVHRTFIWACMPYKPVGSNRVKFITKDVIASAELEKPGQISIWYAPSGQCLESIVVRGVKFDMAICKINETEFVVGSLEGHLCFFSHAEGCNVKETKRIWKAHQTWIRSIEVHENLIVTTSEDCSARLWDATTKRRIAVLNHNGAVFNSAISDQYIVTVSADDSPNELRELRIYNHADGYALVKIFRYVGIWRPRFLNCGRLLFLMSDGLDQDYLVCMEIESESVIAQLKLACLRVCDYSFLDDGRLVAVGSSGVRGVIATLPKYLHALVVPFTDNRGRIRKRRFCTIM